MSDEPQKIEVVSAEVTGATPDAIEVELDVRISKLEAEDAQQDKSLRQVLLSLVHLEDASLKHSVTLALFLAVGFFIASRALGA